MTDLDTPALIDLLEMHTIEYSKMVNEGGTPAEFDKCALTLRAIQAELDDRKHAHANNSPILRSGYDESPEGKKR